MPGITSISNTYFVYRVSVVFFFLTACLFVLLCFVLRTEGEERDLYFKLDCSAIPLSLCYIFVVV